MKLLKKQSLISLLLLMMVIMLAGCSQQANIETTATSTEMPADDFGAALDYDTVYIEDVPESVSMQIDKLILNRGYFKWKIDGENYLLISSGEKPTGGYGIEVVTFGEYDGVYKILVGEGKPGKDAVVPQIITYPYVLVKYTGDLEISEVYNELSEEFELLDSVE